MDGKERGSESKRGEERTEEEEKQQSHITGLEVYYYYDLI